MEMTSGYLPSALGSEGGCVPTCVPGCLPNITRNAIVNCSELVTYDIIKELILKHNLMTG